MQQRDKVISSTLNGNLRVIVYLVLKEKVVHFDSCERALEFLAVIVEKNARVDDILQKINERKFKFILAGIFSFVVNKTTVH